MSKYNHIARYGLSCEDMDRLIEHQNNECAICGLAFEVNRRVIDHCHADLRVRGLLCVRCNSGLGQFRDLEELFLNAIKYLRKDPASVLNIHTDVRDYPCTQYKPKKKKVKKKIEKVYLQSWLKARYGNKQQLSREV